MRPDGRGTWTGGSGRLDIMKLQVPTLALVWLLSPVGPVGAHPAAAQAQPQTSSGPERVLVMPFENVAQDSRIVWLSEAAAVLLADDLNAMGLQAIPREERQEAFERLQVPPAAALTDATVLRLGQLVGAASVVVGTVKMENGTLVAEARQIAIETARLRQRVSDRGPLTDLFATIERMARQLAPATARSREEVERQHPPIAAFESYVKGLVAATPKTAITYLQAALEIDGTFDRARLALWDAFTEQGDHKAAAAAAEAVPERSPFYPRARFLLGRSLLEVPRLDDAFQVYRSLSETRPTAAVFNNLGVIQMRRGNAATGGTPASFFNRAVELDPADSDLFFNLGYASWTVRDAAAATHWLREAVRRNPADGEAHYILATALASAGDTVEAARERELARRLSSTFADWDKRSAADPIPKGLERVKDGIVLPAPRRPEETQVGARDQAAVVAFYVDRGRRFYEQERDRDAVAELNRALFVSPYHAEANLLLGRVHQRAGRLAEAIGSYKIAIWSAESAAAHAALGSAYLESKDTESAKTEAAKALAMDPASAEAKSVMERLGRAER